MSLRDVLQDTAPYEPNRQLVEQAENGPVILTLSVEGLGGINDYSLRVEIPGFDDYLKSVANIIAQVQYMLFALNWEEAPDEPGK